MPTQQPGSGPGAFDQRPSDLAADAIDETFLPRDEPRVAGPSGDARQRRTAAAKAKISNLADKANARVDQASAAASDLNSRATAAYERARASARSVQERVDPLVHEKPYAAVGVAAIAGLFLGMLLGRGPKVIYVRPRD